jgi:hypothetical protein
VCWYLASSLRFFPNSVHVTELLHKKLEKLEKESGSFAKPLDCSFKQKIPKRL